MRAIGNGIGMNYVLEGSGETVTLIHALGLEHTLWDPQVPALREEYRVLRYDVRGHGRSESPPGPYSLELFGDDLHALLQALGVESTHLVGISMGGMIAQWFALHYPDLVSSLVLADTASEHSAPTARLFEQRARTVEERGMEPMVEPALERWFTPEYRARHPEVVGGIGETLRNTNPVGYAASCRAVARLDLTERLQEIRAPALILVGEHDPGTPPDAAQLIHEHLPGSEMRVVPNASHLCNVEQAPAFNQLLLDFLHRVSPPREEGE